jgi:hypothetical protein
LRDEAGFTRLIALFAVDGEETTSKARRRQQLRGLDRFAVAEKTKPGRSRAGEGNAGRSAQAICAYTVSAIGSDTICTNTVRTVSSNTVVAYTVSTVSGHTVVAYTVRTVSSNTAVAYAVSAVSSNTVVAYAVSAVSGNTVVTYAVSAVSGNTTDVGVGRTVFSNYRCVDMFAGIYSRKCKSARSQKRESEAEDQFVSFHGSCSRSIQISR